MTIMIDRRRLLTGGATLAGATVLHTFGGSVTGLVSGARAAMLSRPDYIIRASSNENPYGPSRVALQAISEAMDLSNLYGGLQNELINLQSSIEGVPPESITVGTGSGEILQVSALIASLDTGSLVCADPTYLQLVRYAERMGTEIIKVPVDDNLHVNLQAMYDAIRPDTRMVYLCNPNNPIPSIIEKQALEDFVLEVSKDRLVFVDEAYYEYVDNPDYGSMMHLIADGHPNIIVARTASKIHGIAGLRVGFAFAHPELIGKINELKTGTLNILGQYAAFASYQDMEFQDFSRLKNKESLAIVEGMCDELGIRYVKSNANFAFIETGMDITTFSEAMYGQGIAVGRPFPPYTTWARVSMQKPEEMAYFVQTYKQLFG